MFKNIVGMKELPPRPPKNLPQLFQKDYLDTESDISFKPPKLPSSPKVLPNGGRRVIEQDPLLTSSLNKPAVNVPLQVWY